MIKINCFRRGCTIQHNIYRACGIDWSVLLSQHLTGHLLAPSRQLEHKIISKVSECASAFKNITDFFSSWYIFILSTNCLLLCQILPHHLPRRSFPSKTHYLYTKIQGGKLYISPGVTGIRGRKITTVALDNSEINVEAVTDAFFTFYRVQRNISWIIASGWLWKQKGMSRIERYTCCL